MATGPNLDVRDIKTSDSAFVLAAPLPPQRTFESLKDAWFMEVCGRPSQTRRPLTPCTQPCSHVRPRLQAGRQAEAADRQALCAQVIFDPLGKYGSYGAVEERKVGRGRSGSRRSRRRESNGSSGQ